MTHEVIFGSRVRSYVSVCGELVGMHIGIVVRDYGDTCDVDRMSLHGGAPWIVREAKSCLRVENETEPNGSL